MTADRVMAEPSGATTSVWSPLRHRTYRLLWFGMLVAWMGTWGQTVGAQWLLVDEPNAPTLVALVQAATTLPIMLLALPGGVLADSFDRRWLLFTVQSYAVTVCLLLAAFTAFGQMPPALLLTFLVALGAAAAVTLPTWGASVPELVPRDELRAASRLDLVSVNLSRAVGPALAGLVITHLGGVPVVFTLNAIAVGCFAVTLLLWRRTPPVTVGRRERFGPALRAGGRYIWHEPVARRVLVRATIFVVPGMALWALLPLIATRRLGLAADGYGALFGALGLGAFVGAVLLGKATGRLSVNAVLTVSGLLYAAALAAIVVLPGFLTSLLMLVLAGMAWMATTSSLQAEMQLLLPGWVRARGIAIFTMVFTGSQTGGAILWGLLAGGAGLRTAVLIAAALVLVSALVGLVYRLAETGHLDPSPAAYWGEPKVAFTPEPTAGPVVITVEYGITPDREPEFLSAMQDLRRSRLRTGATRSELYRDAERPDRFIELFVVPSWEEHLRQHEGRLTETDRRLEETVLAMSDPPAFAQHLLPP